LVQDAQFVNRTPAIRRLTVAKTKYLYVSDGEAFASWGVPQELAGVGARKIHDGDETCRRGDRFNHVTFDVAERVPELFPKPSHAARPRRLAVGGVVVDEVRVVSVFERQGPIADFGERIEGRLPPLGYFARHWWSPVWLSDRWHTSCVHLTVGETHRANPQLRSLL